MYLSMIVSKSIFIVYLILSVLYCLYTGKSKNISKEQMIYFFYFPFFNMKKSGIDFLKFMLEAKSSQVTII